LHITRQRGFQVERQVAIAIEYQGVRFDEGFRADLIIENKVIVETKCVEKLNNAHKKQLLSYLRLTGMRLGYLLNFSEALMKDGITRTVNQLVEEDQWFLCVLARELTAFVDIHYLWLFRKICEYLTSDYYSRKDAKHAKKLLIFLNKVIDSTRDAILYEGFTEIQ
jgi:GxxExxY protein